MLKSQVIRQMAPEMDSLRLAMGWTLEDLEKPQILAKAPSVIVILVVHI